MPEQLGSAVLVLKTTIEKYKSEMRTAEKHAKGLDKTFDKLGKKFTKVGKKLTTFVTLPLVALGGIALKNAADFEKQTVAFETMLGSMSKAQVLLQQLEDFSAATPFQLPGLIEGSKRLLAFGIQAQDVIGTMRNLGNAAMGNQEKLDRLTDAYGKVAARGKATMRELNMFLYAGVPITAALAKNFGVTTEELFKMSEQGKVTFQAVNEALVSMTTGTGQFAGMIEKQSQTLSGLFSTLKDNIGLLLKDIAETFLPTIKEIVRRITDWVKWFRGLDDSTKKLIATVAFLVAALGPAIFITGKLILMINALRKAFILAKAALIAFSTAMKMSPLGLALVAIGLLAGGIAYLVTKLRSATRAEEVYTDAIDDSADATNRLNTSVVTLTQSRLILEKAATAGAMREEIATKKAIMAEKLRTREIAFASDEHVRLRNEIKELEAALEHYMETTVRGTKATEENTEAVEDYRLSLDTVIDYWLEVEEQEREANKNLKTRLKNVKATYKEFKKLRMDDLNRELAAIEERKDEFLAAGVSYIEVEEWVQEEIDKIRAKYDQEDYDRKKQYAQDYLDVMRGLFYQLSNIVSAFADLETNRLDNEYQKRKDHIEDTIEDEATKEAALEELDLEFEERRKGMRQDQARRSKVIAIFEAAINTASAIIEALPNIPLAIGIGILGAIQAGIIAATPVPSFATGADFVVPAGYPNDSFIMAAQSGEHVSITPKGERRTAVLEVHDNIFAGPGGMRDFVKIVRSEWESLEVIGQ